MIDEMLIAKINELKMKLEDYKHLMELTGRKFIPNIEPIKKDFIEKEEMEI